jgi:homoserine O-acetyltransferase/O-succinyltransferase
VLKRLLFLVVALVSARTSAAQYPAPVQGDFVLKDFKFRSGEALQELRLHYRTLGRPERGAQGIVRNAVLIMHGTCGSGPGRRGERFAQDRRCE